MKMIFRNRITPIVLLFSAVTAFTTSCSEWTDVESLKLNSPSLEELNKQLYIDYLNDLNRYKAGEHKITVVSFLNPIEEPTKQSERLTAIPDSVDYVCLDNPDNLNMVTIAEMDQVRKKGTQLVYKIDYSVIDEAWKDSIKANPALTEADALLYIANRTSDKLSISDKYNYDGIIIDYVGRSLVSLPQEALAQYNARQQAFLGKILEWKEKNKTKTLFFYGSAQYLVPENMSALTHFEFIILRTAASTNGDDLSLQAYMALQAGMDVAAGEPNPVPNDRFIVAVEMPKAEDNAKVIGYWNIIDSNGKKTLASLGASYWMGQSSMDYTRKGVFMMNTHTDYFNDTYGTVRQVIHNMNPNK